MFDIKEIDKLFIEGIHRYDEGIKFDIDNSGSTVSIFFNSPTKSEINAIAKGSVKVGYYPENEAIFMLFKFENLNWMDAPYSVHLSKNLSVFQNSDEGKGLSLHIHLIDARTGLLKAMRLIGLPTKFSNQLKSAVERQMKMPYRSYSMNIKEAYIKYTTEKLVELAEAKCKI